MRNLENHERPLKKMKKVGIARRNRPVGLRRAAGTTPRDQKSVAKGVTSRPIGLTGNEQQKKKRES